MQVMLTVVGVCEDDGVGQHGMETRHFALRLARRYVEDAESLLVEQEQTLLHLPSYKHPVFKTKTA